MSNGTGHVRPGEVISSSLINQILDRLQALEQGTGSPPTGPGSGPIVIDRFEPAVEVPVGRPLSIFGSNLPFPVVDGSVVIGSTPVRATEVLPSSTRSRIDLVVPDLGGLPATGESLFVRLQQGSASAQRLLLFLPRVDASPPPTITNIQGVPANPGDPPPGVVQIGGQVQVLGQGFATPASANAISLRVLGVTGAQTYPRPGESLTFDEAASNATRIVFTLPDMDELVPIPPRRVRLDLVAGTHPVAAQGELFAIR